MGVPLVWSEPTVHAVLGRLQYYNISRENQNSTTLIKTWWP
jgi:hypothetical protein